MPEKDIQRQVDELRFVTENLTTAVEDASNKVGDNEEKLMRLMDQLERMDGTMLRMRADQLTKADIQGQLTKEDLKDFLDNKFNKKIARGVIGVLAMLITGGISWAFQHFPVK